MTRLPDSQAAFDVPSFRPEMAIPYFPADAEPPAGAAIVAVVDERLSDVDNASVHFRSASRSQESLRYGPIPPEI